MKLNRQRGITIICALLILCSVFTLRWRLEPQLILPLADGTRFVLAGTDHGRQLFYGGGICQAFICKMVRHNLPTFIHNQPSVWPSTYTNGIALFFRRELPDKSDLSRAGGWNGNGELYFLDQSGIEHAAPYHAVNFQTEARQGRETVVAEDIYWELPTLPNKELRLRIRETNTSTGSVATHNFTIKNPAF
jgi:hypothetical protein